MPECTYSCTTPMSGFYIWSAFHPTQHMQKQEMALLPGTLPGNLFRLRRRALHHLRWQTLWLWRRLRICSDPGNRVLPRFLHCWSTLHFAHNRVAELTLNVILLFQNSCGQQGTNEGTFRVITENIPCGTTGTTCSKSIKLFMDVSIFLNNCTPGLMFQKDGTSCPR